MKTTEEKRASNRRYYREHREHLRKIRQYKYVSIHDVDEATKERRRGNSRNIYRNYSPDQAKAYREQEYPNGIKRCPRCGEDKLINGWHTSKTRLDGLNIWCNDCAKDYIRGRHSDLRKNNPAKMLWHSTRGRARGYANLRKVEFTLKVSDIVVPAVCPILGIPLYFACEEVGSKANRYNEHTPSIDRIDSSRGYTPDNIVVISWRANRIKCDATVEELRRIYEFYQQLETAKKG